MTKAVRGKGPAHVGISRGVCTAGPEGPTFWEGGVGAGQAQE